MCKWVCGCSLPLLSLMRYNYSGGTPPATLVTLSLLNNVGLGPDAAPKQVST